MAFVPVQGTPTKASKLFDPRVEVLREIFSDEPDAFPMGQFAEEAWLDLLVDVGLRNKLDKDTILQCAKKVPPEGRDPSGRLCLCSIGLSCGARGFVRNVSWVGGEGVPFPRRLPTSGSIASSGRGPSVSPKSCPGSRALDFVSLSQSQGQG